MNESPRIRVSTLIIGGGLTGLSTAYHLRGQSALIVEKEPKWGGTARSFHVNGFTFDLTGHLLHLHNPYTKRLIPSLLRNNLNRRLRQAWIFSQNTYTRYPYQANTFGLPDSIIDKGVMGFYEVSLKKRPAHLSDLNFESWCHAVYGPGIAENFMLPYNRKLFQINPRKLTVDWCGGFVPKVEFEDVIRGALTDQRKKYGYNTFFFYPREGGIQALADAIGEKLKNVWLSTSVVKIIWKSKIAILSDGREVSYQYLVNTAPLDEFLNLFESLPAAVQTAKEKLRVAGILCINIGLNRRRISRASWIYFPEPEFPFYRVGFNMNFSAQTVPRGCSSVYVEVPMNIAERMSPAQLLKKIKHGLIRARILRPTDKWLVTQFLPIRHAYVIYDRQRGVALDRIMPFLNRHNILSIGRYGGWKYSFMEEAILDGRIAAKAINGR